MSHIAVLVFFGSPRVAGADPSQELFVESQSLEHGREVVDANVVLGSLTNVEFGNLAWRIFFDMELFSVSLLALVFEQFTVQRQACIFLVAEDVGKVELIGIGRVVVVNQVKSSLEDVNHVLYGTHDGSRVQPSGFVVCLALIIFFGAESSRRKAGVRYGPAGRAAEVDGPTNLIGTEDDSGTVIAPVKSILAVCLDGPLIEVGIHLEVSLEQDIWSQLEPDVVSVQDEDQVILLANGLQPLEISQKSLDLGEMLLVGVGFFMCAPVDQDGSGIVEDGGREEQLAEVSVATRRRDEVVETSFAAAA